MTSPWALHLYGDFRLAQANGSLVRLPDAKVEAVLGVLAVHRSYGISREELAQIVWPSKLAEAARASLRQALSLLRRAIGEEALETSRSRCRLKDSFSLDCDWDNPALRDSSSFMPGHQGIWFDEMRTGSAIGSEETATLVDHYLETLSWYASRSPKKLYPLMRASPALVRGISAPTVLELVQRAGRFEEWLGWEAFWRGAAEEELEVCATHLRVALKEADRTADVRLASEVCLELGKVYARTGRYERAENVCDTATNLLELSSSPTVAANVHRLKGNVLVHKTAGEQGFEQLRRAEDLIEDPIERAILLAGHALFEVSAGRVRQAEETLTLIADLEAEVRHTRISSVADLTRAVKLAHRGCHTEAIGRLEGLSARYRALGAVQLTVYAEELLARLRLHVRRPLIGANQP